MNDFRLSYFDMFMTADPVVKTVMIVLVVCCGSKHCKMQKKHTPLMQ